MKKSQSQSPLSRIAEARRRSKGMSNVGSRNPGGFFNSDFVRASRGNDLPAMLNLEKYAKKEASKAGPSTAAGKGWLQAAKRARKGVSDIRATGKSGADVSNAAPGAFSDSETESRISQSKRVIEALRGGGK